MLTVQIKNRRVTRLMGTGSRIVPVAFGPADEILYVWMDEEPPKEDDTTVMIKDVMYRIKK